MQKIIALVLSPNSCDEIRCFANAKVSVFSEAYVILIDPRSKKPVNGSIGLMKPMVKYPDHHDKSRVDLGRLRFGNYPTPSDIKYYESYGYQAPESFSITRNELCIYGSELKRYMSEGEVKVSMSVKSDDLEKLDSLSEAQSLIKELVAEVIKRAKKNKVQVPSDIWPGVGEDFSALILAWARDKKYPHLIKSTATLMDYKKGIIKFAGGSRQTDFYLNLFPEYKEPILRHREKIKRSKLKEGSGL